MLQGDKYMSKERKMEKGQQIAIFQGSYGHSNGMCCMLASIPTCSNSSNPRGLHLLRNCMVAGAVLGFLT